MVNPTRDDAAYRFDTDMFISHIYSTLMTHTHTYTHTHTPHTHTHTDHCAKPAISVVWINNYTPALKRSV